MTQTLANQSPIAAWSIRIMPIRPRPLTSVGQSSLSRRHQNINMCYFESFNTCDITKTKRFGHDVKKLIIDFASLLVMSQNWSSECGGALLSEKVIKLSGDILRQAIKF